MASTAQRSARAAGALAARPLADVLAQTGPQGAAVATPCDQEDRPPPERFMRQLVGDAVAPPSRERLAETYALQSGRAIKPGSGSYAQGYAGDDWDWSSAYSAKTSRAARAAAPAVGQPE
jgi:hypothetical protein